MSSDFVKANRPYEGFSVHGFLPPSAPNPNCCTNVKTLCPACAATALARRGIVGNCECETEMDADNLLPIGMVLNDAPVSRDDIYAGADFGLPVMNYAGWQAERQEQEQRRRKLFDRRERPDSIPAEDMTSLLIPPRIIG